MPGKKQVTRRAALGLMAGGGLLAATQTLGFSNVTAGRGVSVDTATDPNALLGLENLSSGGKTPTFTNNAADEMDITLDSPDDATFTVVGGNQSGSTVTFSLASGASQEVEVDGPDPTTVDIVVDLLDGGTKVGEITLQRDVSVSQASAVREIQGSANSAGNSGKYEFQLENTGDIDVTVVGIGINQTTNQNAQFVSGGGSLFDSDGTELVSDRIPVDSSNPDSDTRRNLDPDLTLNAGNSATLEFNKFRTGKSGGGNGNGNGNGNGGSANADMRGEDVQITLYFEDGSEGTFDLCIGGCDF